MINKKIIFNDNSETYFETFILETVNSKKEKRPALIIIPGGGYVFCSKNESENIALYYASHDIHTVVVNYSVFDNDKNYIEGKQIKQIGYVYKWLVNNADKYNIDKNQINILGFSAGGNLTLNFQNNFKNKNLFLDENDNLPPINKLILGYPRLNYNSLDIDIARTLEFSKKPETNANDLKNWFSKRNIALFGIENPSKEQQEKYSPLKNVDKYHRPTFIFQARDDDTTVIDELYEYIQILNKFGIQHQIHIYNSGGHGFGNALLYGDYRYQNKTLNSWVDESIRWIDERNNK